MSRCFFAGSERLKPNLRSCGGRIQWHHPIEKNFLRQTFRYGAVTEGDTVRPATRHEATDPAPYLWRPRITILADPRNKVDLCWRHHDLVTGHAIRLERDDLPESVFEFAREYGVEARLDRDFPPRVAA